MYDIYVNQHFLKTPLGNPIEVPTLELAKAIEEEWLVDHTSHYQQKPMTSLVATALDCIAAEQDKYVSDVLKLIQTDTILYWADSPENVVSLQEKEWLPIINEVNELLGITLKPMHTFAVQKLAPTDDEKLKAFLHHQSAFTLAGFLHLIQLTGSFCLAYLVIIGRLTGDKAWRLAFLHEDEQEKIWGSDDDEQAKRLEQKNEFEETVRFLNLLAKPEASVI